MVFCCNEKGCYGCSLVLKKDNSLNKLDETTDLNLLMEFRQENFNKWILFCKEKGYEPEVSENE